MRLSLIASSLLLLGACAKGSQPASPVSRDGGETNIELSCGAMEHKVESLYKEAAERQEVAVNLRTEFVSANLHMVMRDCQLSPQVRTECLQQALHVQDIESKCLEYLDDQGTVEGYRFAGATP